MMKFKIFFALFVFLLASGITKAGNETMNNRISGQQIASNASVSVQDSRYPNVEIPTTKVVKGASKIIFSINNASNLFINSNYTIKLGIQINTWDKFGVLKTIPNIELQVNNSLTSTGTDKNVYVIDGSHKVTATILYVKDENNNVIPTGSIPWNLSLEVEQTTERYYYFNQGALVTGINNTLLSTSNELDVFWAMMPGAEEYELEWTYVNNYSAVAGTAILPDQLDYNFRNNSTRVRLAQNHYPISLIFDQGYILYRVRGIGKSLTDVTKDLYTSWGTNPDVAKVSTFPANQQYQITSTTRHENRKNWQYSSSFAEDGKKKEVVSYFDGSLRNRQSVTKSSTNQESIVGETVYDNQGRPAVQILPVPTAQSVIKYYPDFNKSDYGSKLAYDRPDFDTDPTGCTPIIRPMDSTAGGAFYYSQNNGNKAGFQSYVPNAKQYPFSQVEYTPDNTGRIRRQGGVGKEFQLGSSHETKYFYGQPEQEQLDRLFGSEVGYCTHYKKNMVVDANGQVSVSYLDEEGRVIATCLAGDPPNNVNTLPGTDPSVQLTVNYLKANDPTVPNTNKFINNALVFSKELLVEKSGNYQFFYDMTAPKYQDALCMNSPLCFDCIYDLEISVKDACGVDMFPPITQTVGTIDSTCGTSLTFALNPNPVNASLPVGSYTVSKKLTISESAIKYYTDKYIRNATCITPFSTFLTQANSRVDTMACKIDCIACAATLGAYSDHNNAAWGDPANLAYNPNYRFLTLAQYNDALKQCNAPCQPINLCEAEFQTLLSDVSPSGQYAKYDVEPVNGTLVATDPLSLFNSGNALPYTTVLGDHNWKNPLRIVINGTTETPYSDYLEPDLSVSKIAVKKNNSGGYTPAISTGSTRGTFPDGTEYVYARDLSNPLDFISLFKNHPDWAKSLVTYHPEYAYYKWCNRNNDIAYSSTGSSPQLTSDEFDKLLRTTNTFLAAQNAILTSAGLTDTFDIFNKDPYFVATGAASPNHGQGESLRALMITLLRNYGGGTNPTLKATAAITSRCGTQYYGSPSPSCSDYGGGTGSAADIEIRNKEWILYKNIYLAEKQKLQQRAADAFAVSQQNYNGCIGVAEGTFDPFVAGNANFFNDRTPCGIATYPLYKNKVKRFQNSSNAYAQSGIGPNATTQEALTILMNNTDNKMFQETGQCPITNELGFLLDAMATKLLLTTTGTNLSTVPAFTKRLYDKILYPTIPGSTFIDYAWKGVVTGNNLKIQFTTGGIPDGCEINLTMAGDWTRVRRFASPKFTNESPTGTFNFTITAFVDDDLLSATPLIEIPVTGSTCIKLDGCSFSDNCGPSETAFQIQNLLSALASKAKLTTSGVDIKGSDYASLFYNYQIPPTSGSLLGTWSGASNGSGCTLSVNGSSCTINISFVNSGGGFSISDIAYLTNLKLNSASPNTSFQSDAWLLSANQFQKVNVTMTTACYNFQKCVPPPNKCTGPEYAKNDIFYAGLNTIVGQNKLLTNFSMANMPAFAKLFPITNVSLATWTINTYTPATKSLLVYLKEGSAIRGNLSLVFKNTANTHTFADIVSFSNLLVGQYNFTLLAKFSDNTSETIIGKVPELTLSICETCTDYVYAQTVVIDGDCECQHLSYPNLSDMGTELSSTSCAEGFKISSLGVDTCTTWTQGVTHSGRFLMVHWNGAPATAWKQTINASSLLPNKMYTFKVWFKRMTGTFNLTLKIAGVVIKTVNVTPAANPANTWFELSGVWTAGATIGGDKLLEVYFQRVDTGTDTYFALDELQLLRMSPCNGTLKDPFVIKEINPCIKNLMDIANANAIESYNAYIRTIKSQFRDKYIATCKNSLENLKMIYTDREHHFTLYYYDQAGNLIKTVPPEGVALVTLPTEIAQIGQDRLNKTQTFYTKHTLQTRYEYNALNQLIGQAVPDQDLMNKWKLNGAYTIPLATKIYGMAFKNGSNGIVVGDDGNGFGVIYMTTDEGKTWTKVSAFGIGNLQAVQYVGAIGFAVSDRGEFLKNESGTVWSPLSTTSSQKLNDLYFTTDQIGIVVGNGGTILRTVNRGQNWSNVTINAAALNGYTLSSIDFTDLNYNAASGYLYAVGSKGIIMRSSDNGLNWTTLPPVANPISATITLNAVHFINATTGYVAGVETTTGQGIIAMADINTGTNKTTWSYPTQSPLAAGVEFKAIYGADANNVFVGGAKGNLYVKSASSAGVYSKYAIAGLTGTPDITEFSFPDAANPYIGYATLKNGQYIKSTFSAGLTSWTANNIAVAGVPTTPLNGLYFNPALPTTGYVVGDGGIILKTTSPGIWTNNITSNDPLVLQDVCMVKNSNTGYAVGNGGTMLKTTNGGLNWSNFTSGTTTNLKAVAFENETTGVIVGDVGTMRAISSTGTAAISGSTVNMYDVVQLPNTTNWYVAVGTGGKIVRGQSSSSTWLPAVSANTSDLLAVCFVNSVGYACGMNGVVIRSNDGGANWGAAVNTTVTAPLREIYFKDELTGYAMGDGAVIIKTVDGGYSWKSQASTATGNFYTATFKDNGTAIIGGTTTTGTTNMATLSDESNHFSARFWYDRLGRMIVSQNTKQFNKGTAAYSYTQYDELGRIKEVGEIAPTVDITTLSNVHGVVYNDAAYQNWLKTGVRTEVTTTVYDVPVSTPVPGLTQENLRKRVSATYIDTDGDLANGYTQSSVYSYDIHGNVKTLVQDIPELRYDNQQYKRIDYKYDLISGNVNKVAYQEGQQDQFYHQYEYDADNRIIRVFTSNNGITWDQDAKYFYYNHGPLARTELGDDKVQAMDYVYTLQGWLKGVNSNTLNTTRDPGKDGSTGGLYTSYPNDIHAKIGRDAYGYSLSYFDAIAGVNNNDYYAIQASNNAVANDFEADASASPGYMADAPNLYNGNIKRMVTTFTDIKPGSPTLGQALPQLTAYRYDQLNRLVQMKAYRDINTSTNISGAATSTAYLSTMSYDANGNLLTMNVNGDSGNPTMDRLKYKYDWIDVNVPSKGKRSNRLYHVKDTVSTYTTDIDDQGVFTPFDPVNPTFINTKNNYGYDELGNLKRDDQEGITQIDWTVYGKIKTIQRNATSKATLDFTYDASGNRLSKTSTLNGAVTATYYIRDASGNIMATYEKACTYCNAPVKEYSLYGSSRVGTLTAYPSFVKGVSVYSRIRKNKNYELSNHLGNVLAVVSDKRQPHSTNGTTIDYYDPTLQSTQDYYAFGGAMPGRGYTVTSGYRYGFNGKENDNEVKGQGNQQDYGMRIYDPRLGKFLSVDPLIKKYPELTPYQFASNTPIQGSDLDGLELLQRTYDMGADGKTKLTKTSYIPPSQREPGKVGTLVTVNYRGGSTSFYSSSPNDKPVTSNPATDNTPPPPAKSALEQFGGVLEGLKAKVEGTTFGQWEGYSNPDPGSDPGSSTGKRQAPALIKAAAGFIPLLAVANGVNTLATGKNIYNEEKKGPLNTAVAIVESVAPVVKEASSLVEGIPEIVVQIGEVLSYVAKAVDFYEDVTKKEEESKEFVGAEKKE